MLPAADTLLRSEGVPLEGPRDEELIRRYAEQGDEASFVLLVRRYLPHLRRVLYGVLNGNLEDMQDVEQEVLIALCRNLPRYRFDSAFSTYLYRFAKNKAVDFLRAQARHKRVVEAVAQRLRLSPPEGGVDSHAESRVLLEAALGRLSADERLLLGLKENEGLRLSEIAEITGLPEGTIKSRLHRIRGKIVKSIERSAT